ncbi:hypothetical protein ATY76_11445 [Rhizobium sp. R339]|uniref:hypothetical protein n=1 Tax=Rhizobium sp. R339 TaxID=1764273 RepID=UPI000B52E498|nr:hypothetical protein [Rhizobium sp. R339]OWV69096.1 hypothetical protein ATY76_11445 [Rhizobium sp. R339]
MSCLRQLGRKPHGSFAQIALKKACGIWAFTIYPPPVTKSEKSRIMRDRSLDASAESPVGDLIAIRGAIESLWQRFHNMMRIRTGT